MSEVQAPKILVIEDETTQRILVKEYLEESGYVVRLADDGRRGLEMASAITPDLILLDLLLPSMDGYTLCERLKADEATAHIPVILVTAAREHDVIERGMAAGASDFVTKPVDWSYLSDRVAHVLQQSRDMKRLTEEKQASEKQLLALLESKDLSPEQIEEIRQLSVPSAGGVSAADHERALESVRAEANAQVAAERQLRAADALRAQTQLTATRDAFWSVLAQTSQSYVPMLSALDQLTSIGQAAREDASVTNGADAPQNAVQQLLASSQNMALLAQYMMSNAQADDQIVDLVEVATEAVDHMRAHAEKNQVVLHADVADTKGEIKGNREQLGYALHGLLANAVKHCPPNASITVTVADVPGEAVQMSVADNGVGMAPAVLQSLRQSCVQPSVNQSGKFGFGVPLAMAIMKAHEGQLQIESEIGKGTTVTMQLPHPQIADAGIPAGELEVQRVDEMPAHEDVPIARLNALLAG